MNNVDNHRDYCSRTVHHTLDKFRSSVSPAPFTCSQANVPMNSLATCSQPITASSHSFLRQQRNGFTLRTTGSGPLAASTAAVVYGQVNLCPGAITAAGYPPLHNHSWRRTFPACWVRRGSRQWLSSTWHRQHTAGNLSGGGGGGGAGVAGRAGPRQLAPRDVSPAPPTGSTDKAGRPAARDRCTQGGRRLQRTSPRAGHGSWYPPDAAAPPLLAPAALV